MDHSSSLPVFPRLLRRIQAALIDSLIFVLFFYVWIFTLGALEGLNAVLKVASFVIGALLLEPVLVSQTGGTFGHHIIGLRVEDSASSERIGLLRATIRAVLRLVLGGFSLIFILATRKHQAIHDLVTHTVVVLRHPESVTESEKFRERELVPQGFELPGAPRRAIAIVVYGIVSLLVFSTLIGFVVSDNCYEFDECTDAENVTVTALSILWYALLVPIVIFAWRGRLFGCRRRKVGQFPAEHGNQAS